MLSTTPQQHRPQSINQSIYLTNCARQHELNNKKTRLLSVQRTLSNVTWSTGFSKRPTTNIQTYYYNYYINVVNIINMIFVAVITIWCYVPSVFTCIAGGAIQFVHDYDYD